MTPNLPISPPLPLSFSCPQGSISKQKAREIEANERSSNRRYCVPFLLLLFSFMLGGVPPSLLPKKTGFFRSRYKGRGRRARAKFANARARLPSLFFALLPLQADSLSACGLLQRDSRNWRRRRLAAAGGREGGGEEGRRRRLRLLRAQKGERTGRSAPKFCAKIFAWRACELSVVPLMMAGLSLFVRKLSNIVFAFTFPKAFSFETRTFPLKSLY